LNNKDEEPYFIICAVIIDDKNKRNNLLDEKFAFIRRNLLKKSDNYEIKYNNLNDKKHKLILNELSTLDYGFAAAIFIKEHLDIKSIGVSSKTFYQLANQYLVEKILIKYGKVNLYFDNYSGDTEPTKFDKEFCAYIRKNNLFWPKGKINELTVLDSRKSNKVQMVDLIAGAVRKAYIDKEYKFLSIIENKLIDIYHFPNTIKLY
jgi:hypothetical protein